jgi:inhibitor of KinA
MAVPSLHIKGLDWSITHLNEQAVILSPLIESNPITSIHNLLRMLESNPIAGIIDVVPAYENLTVFLDYAVLSQKQLIERLTKLQEVDAFEKANTHHIQVDYNKGLDWGRAQKYTKLSKAEIIKKHTETIYTVAMIGFLPGFIFLDGLDPTLTIPRLDSPRNQVPAGAIGIGGTQTGLYSIQSAGGWNIIGTTTQRFFDATNQPPISVKPGDFVQFIDRSS